MRLAHHLLRRPSGMWYFRIYIPKDLRPVFGMTIFKRSLGTHDPVSARTCAYALGARCAQIFASARIGTKDLGMDWDDLLSKIERFEIKAGPEGVSVKTNGTDADNAAGLKALQMALEKPLWPAPAPGSDVPQPKLTRTLPKPRSDAPTLAQALRQYEDVEAKNIKPNTWVQRQRSSASFLKYIGSGVKVDEVTRPMAAAWANQLQRDGLTKRYVANMVSHVAQIFQKQVQAGHLATNVVKGVVVMKAADKAARRNQGHAWEAFELADLPKIFNPVAMQRMRQPHVRWGALIGLYSGARVSEVAQLYLRDFEEVDGVPCVRITNDNDGQSLKTEASRRLVPLHPDLIRLGLWKRVEALRERGEERLFPTIPIKPSVSPGNAISKGFSYQLKGVGIKARRAAGTVGFHSLRKNMIQTLQGASLPAERRRAFVGHEAGEDVHEADYMRPWTPRELAQCFPGIGWGTWLNFDGLLPLLELEKPLPVRTRLKQGAKKKVA
ncbi:MULTISPECIES: site-specific integrase [unclassified Luteibacter]|uniref:site-specific integrase n=1 Tax=Luteibacter sp. PvP019 TaxID=3156436 RepID=UPI003390CD1F